jgi:hypothetical protein
VQSDLVELMGPVAIAARLAIARSSALQLIEAGLAGRRYVEGQRQMVERERVEALARRDPVDLHGLPPALIVRVGPPQPDTTTDPRDWYGWYELAPKDTRRGGISRWWRVRDADRLIGRLFVVTVSGFVVDVARIAGARSDRSDWDFQLVDPAASDTDAESWQDVRLKSVGGGAVIRHLLD